MSGCVSKFKRAIWIACVVIGMATTAEAAAVTLAWNPNTEPDIESYRISYGTASGQYTSSVDVGNKTSHTLTNLFAGQTYYFVLQAINAAGPSPYSNEVSVTLTSPLTVMNLTANRTSPQPAATTITFSATANGGTPPYQYKWWIVTGTTQTVGSNWSTNSSFAWTPTVANPNYTIRVWARNASSTADAPDSSAATLEMGFAITSSGGATNQAPTVNAGADQTITLPSSATLNATVSDDGLPSGNLTRSWTRVSGPGAVTFSAPTAATTAASFSAAGTYVLRLTASDGALSAWDELTVTVAPNAPGPTGLIAGYTFNAGSGPTAVDSSGNGITGTLNGATWTAAGKYGNALSFNGASAYVDLGNPTALQGTGSTTWAAWVFATGVPANDGQIIAKSDNPSGWQLKTSPDTGPHTFAVAVSGSGGGHTQRYSRTVRALNTWYHVAGTYNATARTLDIYVNGVLDNGVLIGTVPVAQVVPNINVTIGRRTNGYHFRGVIDDVRVYNRALTPAEISQISQ